MAGQVIGAVYIYCTRQDVVHALKATLRAANFPDERIFVELSVESCAEHLRNRSDAAVIIDWDTDHRNALKLLAYARADHKLDSRPTMLITKRVSNEIVAAGAEHHVTTVHVGDVSVTSLKVMVGELLRAGTDNSVDKELLRNVSNLRLDDKWTEATAILEKMRDRDPGNVRVACELAENLIRASAWQSAISTLEPFSTIDQPNVRALHLLGRCYLKLGRAGEASTLLSRAKIISPYNVERLVDLGNALLHIDQVEEAQQVFEEALDLSPGNFGATQGLGQVKLLQGELNEGLKLIQSASATGNWRRFSILSRFSLSTAINIRVRSSYTNSPRRRSRVTTNSSLACFSTKGSLSIAGVARWTPLPASPRPLSSIPSLKMQHTISKRCKPLSPARIVQRQPPQRKVDSRLLTRRNPQTTSSSCQYSKSLRRRPRFLWLPLRMGSHSLI